MTAHLRAYSLSLRAVREMIKTLVSVRLRSLIAGLRGKKKDGTTGTSARLVLLTLAYLYIGAVFLLIFGGAAVMLAPFMIAAGLDALYFAIFMLITFSVIFFLSIFETKSHLFECKDNELLMAMPIKTGDIVISRIIVVLILNYVEGAVAFLPAVIAYAAFGGSVWGILGALTVFLFLPLLATSLSSGVGYLVARLAKKFKNNSFISLLFSLIFLGLYFWGYSALLSVPESELENVENLIPLLESALKPLSVIGLSATLHPVATPVFVAVSFGIAYIAYRAIASGYDRITAAGGAAEKKKYKSEPSHASSAFFALAKKEFKRFTSSAAYMMNGGIGVIMYIVMAVAVAINSSDIVDVVEIFSAELGMPIDAKVAVPAIAIGALVLLSSTVTISASALSLEGKNFWIIKTMPVGTRTVILAKLVPHVVISSLASVIASLVLIFSLGIEALYAVFVIVTPILANVFAALIGIMMNILMPKLEFENEMQPIKQSAAVGLTMLITMVFGMAYLGASFVFTLFGLGTLVILLGAAATLALVAGFTIVVLIPMAKRLESFSA